LWVLRVYKLPGTHENILGGKEGVCMFLSLSSPPEGSGRNPEQLQKFAGERVLMLERWEHILARNTLSTPHPLLASKALYSQQNDEDKERSGTDSHTLATLFIF